LAGAEPQILEWARGGAHVPCLALTTV
jgi:hypothetical protein